jgi:hypothetical protein
VVPFTQALADAPRTPGVYLAREGPDGPIVYVGCAGEREGSGRPHGIHGRLARYASGKAIASGLGEAVFNRALADPDWLRARLVEVDVGTPSRASVWGKLAAERADLYVCWAQTADRQSARELETRCEQSFRVDALCNRHRSGLQANHRSASDISAQATA